MWIRCSNFSDVSWPKKQKKCKFKQTNKERKRWKETQTQQSVNVTWLKPICTFFLKKKIISRRYASPYSLVHTFITQCVTLCCCLMHRFNFKAFFFAYISKIIKQTITSRIILNKVRQTTFSLEWCCHVKNANSHIQF